ncbi:hypothetical protein Salat_2675600 [Sesamum alatum]|uniref:Uncharacterized protein n=1 Tax=Sesamum alatum TaxID=300844 RepID=A0AAE2CB60_9LAMI|nr:hypothetical protein Salat_2675600 [Sesamum alatum]
MEQLALDSDNIGTDYQALLEMRVRHHEVYQEILNFSRSQYPGVRVDPTSTYDPMNATSPSTAHDPTNVAGPSTAHDPTNAAGPSTAYTPDFAYTPSDDIGANVHTPATAYTPDFAYTLSDDIGPNVAGPSTFHPGMRPYYSVSPIPFEDLDLSTPIEMRHDIPRRNRRRRGYGIGGHY